MIVTLRLFVMQRDKKLDTKSQTVVYNLVNLHCLIIGNKVIT